MKNNQIKHIQKLLNSSLPGAEAQLKMAPPGRKLSTTPKNNNSVKKSAVLLLLWQEEEELHLTLTVRPDSMKNHPSQISFPGGGYETKDTTLMKTAQRETEEEVGVKPDSYEVIGRLTSLYVSVSNYCIKPYVAYSPQRPDFIKNSCEVAEILTPSLSTFKEQNDSNTFIVDTTTGKLEVPYFSVEDRKLWGATAMILNEFLEVLKGNRIN